MENKTAVEIYSNEILKILGDAVNSFTKEQTLASHYALKQAIETEKQQIESAYTTGYNDGRYEVNFDGNEKQYYQQTFKK